MFDYMGAFLFRSGFANADNVITKRCSKTITWLLLSRLQYNKPHSPEPSGTFRKLHPQPTPAHTPEPSGTFRNLSPEPTPAQTGTLNLPEPFRNLHQHTPQPSETFRNLPPEPTPAHTGTLRNRPEPASRTYTSTDRNPPEPSESCIRNLH